MNERAIEELYRRWRAAEARGDEAAADAALAAMVRGLPLEAPSPGFAARVLARRAVSPSRWAAAVLALLAAGTLGLASAVVTLLPKLDLGAGVRGFNGLVVMLWGWIADGVGLWLRAAEWSALVARVVAVPEVAWSLLGAALAAALSFYLLQRILANERKLIRAQRH